MNNEFEHLIKLLEEYIDPENKMDDECMIKVIRSTNRDAQARKIITMLKNWRIPEPQQPNGLDPVERPIMPCPFCGNAPVFPDAKDVTGTCYEAGCEECGIASILIQIIECFDYPRDQVQDSWNNETMRYGLEYIEVARSEAIERWNTRVGYNA